MDYHQIYRHYEKCFETFGDTPKGVDWPNMDDLEKRFRVMLDLTAPRQTPLWRKVKLLDFGCGTALLLDFIKTEQAKGKFTNLEYIGADISPKFIEYCRKKYSDTQFIQLDIIENAAQLETYDYAVLNGVFTMKIGLTYEQMFEFFKNTIKSLWPKIKVGLAFNVMSKQVDWERNELFHLPMDEMAGFLCKDITRDFVIRNDYGLYEYTVYVKKEKE